jgi:hypothetical protein
MFYSKIDPWNTWSTPTDFAQGPGPGSLAYNVVASKVSPTVVAAWIRFNQGEGNDPADAFYKKSTDDGAHWSDTMRIPEPDIYQIPPDTQPMFWQIYPYFDALDSLHVVATIIPLIQGTLNSPMKSAIADWSNAGGWSLIELASTDTLAGAPESTSGFEPYADWATMAVGTEGELVCVWEQFDSLNRDSTTGECRRDILKSVSTDHGASWWGPDRVAHGGTVSLCYPSVSRTFNRGFLGDTFTVVYLQDQQAGPAARGTGTNTKNPVICQRAPIWTFPGVDVHNMTFPPVSCLCQATPSIFRGRTTISYSLPKAGNAKLRIYDAMGRPVKMLVSGNAAPGRYTTTWDGRTDKGVLAAAGIYFYTLSTCKTSISKKLTLLP